MYNCLSIFRTRSGAESEEDASDADQAMPSANEDDMQVLPIKKSKKSSTKRDWSIQDPQKENDLIEWYQENPYIWLITDKDYMNYIRKNNAIEDKAKELGLTGKAFQLILTRDIGIFF